MSGYNIYGIATSSRCAVTKTGTSLTTSDYSVGYNKYTAELRYPVILKPRRRSMYWASSKAVMRSNRGRSSRPSRSSVRPASVSASTAGGGYAGYRLGLRIRRPGRFDQEERQPVPLRTGPAVLNRGTAGRPAEGTPAGFPGKHTEAQQRSGNKFERNSYIYSTVPGNRLNINLKHKGL